MSDHPFSGLPSSPSSPSTLATMATPGAVATPAPTVNLKVKKCVGPHQLRAWKEYNEKHNIVQPYLWLCGGHADNYYSSSGAGGTTWVIPMGVTHVKLSLIGSDWDEPVNLCYILPPSVVELDLRDSGNWLVRWVTRPTSVRTVVLEPKFKKGFLTADFEHKSGKVYSFGWFDTAALDIKYNSDVFGKRSWWATSEGRKNVYPYPMGLPQLGLWMQ